MMPHIEALQQQGLSLREMVQELNLRGVPAARGGRWHITTLRKVLSRVLVASLARM
jgi:Recombinase